MLCQSCNKESRRLWEVHVSTQETEWSMSMTYSGHIKICTTCRKNWKSIKLKLWDDHENYKRWGKVYCPYTPIEWSQRLASNFDEEKWKGKQGCHRACWDWSFEPMEGCKCIHCLDKAKWTKAYREGKMCPAGFKPPIHSSHVVTENPYRTKSR